MSGGSRREKERRKILSVSLSLNDLIMVNNTPKQ
jgi:hypothetical protein